MWKILVFCFVVLLSRYIFEQRNKEPSFKIYDVIIVGSGVSGISCGNELKSNFNILILEARNRTLGRVYTEKKLFKTPMDLGAHWIHGREKNPLHDLVSKFNTSTITTNYEETVYYNLTNHEMIINSERKRHKSIVKTIDKLVDGINAADDVTAEVLFQEVIKNETNLTKQQTEMMHFNIGLLTEIEVGDEMKYLSGKYHWTSEAFKGDDVVLPNGYSDIFNEMYKDLNIKFNSKVTEITKISTNFYSVRTENGENFYTEKVVVTVPLGVLKKNIIKFSPPLPKKKLDSIQKLGMGLLNKVIVEFEKDSLKDLPKMIALVPNRKYINDPFGFISLLNWKHYSNVDYLIAFSHGDDGRRMEKWSDEKTIETLMERISLFKLPKPIAYHITRWNSDEFAFGSYSYVKHGSTLEDMDELKNPIENEIYFAGEATISKYHQTVHGAMMSGIEVANELKK